MTAAINSQNTQSVLDKINNSRTSLANNEQTFLSLLTTQLKNQDPLQPTDTNQMTQQITSMTGVAQQLVTNDLLAALVGMNTGTGLSEGVGMMGKIVTATTATSPLQNGSATFSWPQPGASTSLQVDIKTAAGKVVRTLTPDDQKSGSHTITWDGKDDSGAQLPDGGVYTIAVTAKGGDGKDIKATNVKGRTTGLVSAIDNSTGNPMVIIDGVSIPVDNVIGVSNTAANSNNSQSNAQAA